MTGELCDCFARKRDGVHAILDAVADVAGPVPVAVWQTDGCFVRPAVARDRPLHTAAANWLALATYAARLVPDSPALLLDVGSTTTDIIPIAGGQPVPRGRTDPERLASGELVYTGARRTPVCAVLHEAVAAELFATTLDAYLCLGWTPEAADDRDTADGRPATRRHAHARLARMMGADADTVTTAETEKLAQRVYQAQARLITAGLDRVLGYLPGPAECVIVAGSGTFLASRVLAAWCPPAGKPGRVLDLGDSLSPALSTAACAYAVAVLAAEGRHG
jgi:probable H4MPT-linked C1 transfer pathway protein